MGNQQQPLKKFPQKSYQNEWQTIDHMQNYNIVRNTKTNQIGQSRKFKLDPIYDLDQELKIYQLRGLADQPIVKVYSAGILEKVSRKGKEVQGTGGICGRKSNYLEVVSQRIQYRLDELPQLTFAQSLYILLKSLQGYQHLYPRTGPVHITPKMLGLTPNSQLKVWINQDFSQNHPNTQIKSLLSTRNQKLDRQYNLITPQFRDQKEMIENIIDVVQDKCQHGMFNSQFHNQIRMNCYCFGKVTEYVEEYIRQKNLRVPGKIFMKFGKSYLENWNQSHRISQPQFLTQQPTQKQTTQPLPNTNPNISNPIHISHPYSCHQPTTIPPPPLLASTTHPKIPTHQPITNSNTHLTFNSTVSHSTLYTPQISIQPLRNTSHSSLHSSPSQNILVNPFNQKPVIKFSN